MADASSHLVLGLSTSGHDTAYAIIDVSGNILVHCEYERDARIKEAAFDPLLYFLSDRTNDIFIDRIKAICIPFCPRSSAIYADIFSATTKENSGSVIEVMDKLILLAGKNRTYEFQELIGKLELLVNNVNIFKCYGHHECHAAEAVYSTGLDADNSNLIITADGGGWDFLQGIPTEVHSGVFIQDKSGFRCLSYDKKTSFGGVYELVTRKLGYSVGPPQGSQQGSVMGLAAFGDPKKYSELFQDQYLWQNTAQTNPDRGKVLAKRKVLGLEIDRLIRTAQDQQLGLEQAKADIAAGLQKVYEEIYASYTLECASLLEEEISRITLSGGCALNCAAVGKLSHHFLPLEVNVSIAPYDAGLAIGAAFRYILDRNQSSQALATISRDRGTPFLGRSYSELQIMSAISSAKLHTKQLDINNLCRLLGNKKIVAVFQGRSESGRRALCNRSILADPRDASIRDIMNAKVKHRPLFRPFAPVLPLENVGDYFEYKLSSPFMSHAIPFKQSVISEVPAVVHKDGTGRLQTVQASDNPWMYKLLVLWGQYSGHPILINTSFNDNEPIVEDPSSAVLCYLRTNIDYLVFPDIGLICSKNPF